MVIKKDYWDRTSYSIISIDSIIKNKLQSFKKKFEFFFDLPESDKMKYWLGDCPIPFRGYFPPFKQNYDSKRKYKDFKEGYDFGVDLLTQKGRTKEYRHFFGPNIFPEEIPEIKKITPDCLSFFKKISGIIRNYILEDLKTKNYFLASKNFFNRSVDTLRVLNYNISNRSKDNFFTTPLIKHKDPGLFTCIHTNKSGLEFYNSEIKKWQPILVNQDQLIVIWGQFLEMITNGKYKASLHRVKKIQENKMSLCFFHNPNYDATSKQSSENTTIAGRQIFCYSIGCEGNEEDLYKDHLEKRVW